VTGRSQSRRVVLHIGQPDYFTQIFENEDNDVAFQVFTFTPNGGNDFYTVCREEATEFPSDPALGASLVLADEATARVDLTGGAQVRLFGTGYSTLWISANGYIAFAGAAAEFWESLATHFSA